LSLQNLERELKPFTITLHNQLYEDFLLSKGPSV
jgi:hypothetical protein